jgi:hypothetical protein
MTMFKHEAAPEKLEANHLPPMPVAAAPVGTPVKVDRQGAPLAREYSTKPNIHNDFWYEQYKAAFSALGDAKSAKSQADESVKILGELGIGRGPVTLNDANDIREPALTTGSRSLSRA